MRPSHSSHLARAVGFIHDCARRQAQRTVDIPAGFAVFNEEFDASYDHNRVIFSESLEPVQTLAISDRVMADAGVKHRLVLMGDDHGIACAALFRLAGYRRSTNLIMLYAGRDPERPVCPTVTVERVDVSAFAQQDRRLWRQRLPHAPTGVIEQLVRRRVTLLDAAEEVAFLAVRDANGHVCARADLYVDPVAAVAQIEDVWTDPSHRGRGYAHAILSDGLWRARAAGCDVIFVTVDADDGVQGLYVRLGYTTGGRCHLFIRHPEPREWLSPRS